jgi:hypothetical protein
LRVPLSQGRLASGRSVAVHPGSESAQCLPDWRAVQGRCAPLGVGPMVGCLRPPKQISPSNALSRAPRNSPNSTRRADACASAA